MALANGVIHALESELCRAMAQRCKALNAVNCHKEVAPACGSLSERPSPANSSYFSPPNKNVHRAIRSKVGDRVDAYCRDVLVRDPRKGFWLPAYENIHGTGTQVQRARAVARILEDRAQLPNEGLGKFTKDIWQIVQETTAVVCSSNEPQKTPLR
jgi:hypothetical protein